MATLAETRRKAGEARARADQVQARISGADDPSAEDVKTFNDAIVEAEKWNDQVELMERMEATRKRAADLEARARGEKVPDPATAARTPRYSLVRAMQGALDQREGKGVLTGFEKEKSDELARSRGKTPLGVFVPLDQPLKTRGVLTTTTGAGAIPTLVEPTLIDVLRAKLPLAQIGAQVVTDQRQPFKLPKVTSGIAAYHRPDETTPLNRGNMTIGGVTFSPKEVVCQIPVSRQFLLGAGDSSEELLKDSLGNAVAAEAGRGMVSGSGTNGEPKGITNYSAGDGMNVLALGTNGGVLDWAAITKLQGMVANANAGMTRGWLTNALVTAVLEATPRGGSTSAIMVIDGDEKIGRFPFVESGLVPSSKTKGTGTNLSTAIFGDFSQMVVVFFSGVDLIADPYTIAPDVLFTAVLDYDVALVRPEAFAKAEDIVTTG